MTRQVWAVLAALPMCALFACRAAIPDATFVCASTPECPPGFFCDSSVGLCLREVGCAPQSCEELRAQCGTADDGCGAEIECGGCAAPMECGGGGLPNVCGCTSRTCEAGDCGVVDNGCGALMDCGGCDAPAMCAEGRCVCPEVVCEAKECGTKFDGCGGMITCEACGVGESCGAEEPNRCGVGTCTPRTCPEQGIECGPATDGCGSPLSCGVCAAPASCGGGGTAGVCGCIPRTCDTSLRPSDCGTVIEECGTSIECGGCAAGTVCAGNLCVCDPDAREVNDTFGSPNRAGPLVTQSIASLNMGSMSDEDWFAFDLTMGSTLGSALTVRVTTGGGSLDNTYDLAVYFDCSAGSDPTCTLGDSATFMALSGCEMRSRRPALPPVVQAAIPCTSGTVYVRVSTSSFATCLPYALVITRSDG